MKNTFISLVITSNGEVNGEWLHGYAEYLRKNYSDYEILIIDYGTGDTDNHNKSQLLAAVDKMRWLKITDACSLEVAMAAGMENAIGDIIIIGSMDNLTEEGFEGFCIGCVFKYISRYRKKNGVEDLKKAAWYLAKAIKTMEQEGDQ